MAISCKGHFKDGTVPYDEPQMISRPERSEVMLGMNVQYALGYTRVTVHITGESFRDVARMMMEANREAAVHAFSLALAGELGERS